jgi:hypothetical protein
MHRTLLASILVSATTIAYADTPTRTDAADSDSLGEVKFKRGSKRIVPAARDDVEQIAAWHADHPDAILILEGHTSREGTWNQNLRVSQDRTDAVRDALVVAGADPSRIVLTARGDNRGGSRRAAGRVVIRASGDYPMLARWQRTPTGGQDTRAARRPATVEQRRTGGDTARGRELVGGGNTIVIVPGAGGNAPTIVQSGGTGGETGTDLDNAGGAGRTSGGTGTSAQTGLGFDPTDGEDRISTNPAGTPNVVGGGVIGGGVVGGGVAADGTAARGSRAGGGAAAGTAGGATGGTSTGSPVGAGVTGTGPGAATAPTAGGATGAGTATGAGASGAGTAGSTTGAGTARGAGAPVGGASAPTGGGGGSR